jgi:SAM-dependent methyltransferase
MPNQRMKRAVSLGAGWPMGLVERQNVRSKEWHGLAAFALISFLIVFLAGSIACLAQSSQMPSGDMGNHHKSAPGERGYHRTFNDAETWAKRFDDPARDLWQKPDETLDALQLTRTTSVADIGAGTGYFSVRIARRVPDGKIFAVDIEPDMVRYLGERARREHLDVLRPVQASADSPDLPEPVDVVLVVDTYHHIDNRVAYFSRLKSSLRTGGRLAIVDFKPDASEGPPSAHRIPPERVTAELEQAGYALLATHRFLPQQYFLVFEKKAL